MKTRSELRRQFNFKFYAMGLRPQTLKLNLAELHKKRGEFEWLQKTHNYIQWLFPNFRPSSFNRDSFRLEAEQAAKFRRSQEIGLSLLRSFELFLHFMGLRLVLEPDSTPRVEKADDFRFKQVYNSLHNHLRFLRISSCLSVTGFRPLAKAFAAFLLQAIKQDKLYMSVWDKELLEVFAGDDPRELLRACCSTDEQVLSAHALPASAWGQAFEAED